MAAKVDSGALSLDQILAELEAVVEALGQESANLDDLVSTYQEGLSLAHTATMRLRELEEEVKRLSADLPG